MKLFFTVFVTIFLAEIADKTQIATMLYASGAEHSKLAVFLGAAMALVLATALAVFVGSALSQFINEKIMMKLAGGAFIAVGIWTLAQ
ncbi:MAG: TMEM165/GDT1 family protein [Syntrophales bacterium]|nr:TMEM165/GDT1 family protein [Syntrophales bacterium]